MNIKIKKINVFIKKKKKYEILIKFNLLENINFYSNLNKLNKIMFITNKYLFNKYFDYLINKIKNSDINYKYYIIPDGESSKSIDILYGIITALLNYSYNKDSYLVAFGGGVIGDLTGFAASIYLRGIKYIQIPTTLLSQVDSSIGGKTAINHALGKNMIGTFYQPSSVFIDTKFLYSLSKKELSSGIAEIIKYSIILDYNFFVWIEKNLKYILNLKKEYIEYCIYKCCKIKSLIIKHDEKELNIRSILNFGHTFGHAIENFMGYGNWTHGEAISYGMIIASKLSYNINNLSYEAYKRIKNLLYNSDLPINGPKNMKIKDYINIMKKDKKNLKINNDDNLNLVLIKNIGEAEFVKNVSIKDIKKSINNY